MLKRGGQGPWARLALGLFAVAAVGALIGVAAEQFSFRSDVREDEVALSTDIGGRPSAGATPLEEEVVRRATDGLPRYGDAAPMPLAADYLGESAPIAAAWFETADRPEQVLGFYHRAFLDRGLPVLEDQTGPGSGYVGYRNPRTHEVHLVTAVQEHGRTLVFVSSGKVEDLRTGDAELPSVLPRPEGLEKPLVLTFRREGEVEFSVVASVSGQQVGALAEFYRKAFTARGWTVDSVRASGEDATVETSRAGMRAITRLRRRSPEEVELYVRLVTRT